MRKSKTLAPQELPRERALEVCLRWLSLASPPVWATLLAQAWRDDISPWFISGIIGITSLLPVLYLVRARLGYVLATKLCLLVLFLTTAYVETIVGFTPTTAVMVIFGILLATMLLGDKAFSAVLVACAASLALGWVLYTEGVHPLNAERLVDPRSPFVWIRFGFAMGILGGAVRDWAWSMRSLGHEKIVNELGGVLASSLDTEQTLRELCRRVVQDFADFCLVFVVEGGQLKRAHAAARDPAHEPLVEPLGSVPVEPSRPHFVGDVLRTQKAELVNIARRHRAADHQSVEQLALLQRLGACSMMSAPAITSRGEVVGVLSAVSSSRVYDPEDLHILSDVAARVAMAIESASLYVELRRAHDEIRAQFHALDEAHRQIRTLTGLLPVCAWCGRIRDDRQLGRWRRFDEFLTEHTSAEVSHGICPDCEVLQGSPPGARAPQTG